MASTVFTDFSTPIISTWLNTVNQAVYQALGLTDAGPFTGAAVVANIGAVSTISFTAYQAALATSTGSTQVGWVSGATGAVLRTVSNKLRDVVNVKDFGAVGDGVTDDTTALALAAAYVNGIALTSRPVELVFPRGTYLYTTTLWFTRPVFISALGDATLNYTGVGSSALKLGANGITAFDVFLQGEYTVDGLRITGGGSALYGIYLNNYVIEPRIRNVTFEDFGNSTSYCIFGQSNNWDVIIENCRCFVYSSVTATGNFIAITGRDGAGVYDGGNSRVTIRDCWMTSYSNQVLGYFAYVNAVKSRIIGGGFQHATGGILLGGFSSGTLIDGVYAELSTPSSPYYVQPLAISDGIGGYWSPENIVIRAGYINFHQEVITNTGKLIAVGDANVKLKGWSIEEFSIANYAASQNLITQNDVSGQTSNRYAGVLQYIGANGATAVAFNIRGGYTNAEPWSSTDVEVGSWTPSLGGSATYTSRTGKYTRVGNQVTAQLDVTVNVLGTGSTVSFTGLPYACNATVGGSGSVDFFSGLAAAVYVVLPRVDPSSSAVTVVGLPAAATGLGGSVAVIGNGARLVCSVTYFIS